MLFVATWSGKSVTRRRHDLPDFFGLLSKSMTARRNQADQRHSWGAELLRVC